MKKYLIYGGLTVIIIGGLYVWNSEKSYSPTGNIVATTTNETTLPQTNATTTPTITSYTMAQVKEHNDEKSCYSAINGKVYDLTSWIDKHPGGRLKILLICGKDGTTLFNLQHGGKEKQENKLATFKIGILSQ